MLDMPSDDGPPHAKAPDANAAAALRAALRLARAEAAAQTDVVMTLREAEIARLEILKEALDPVLAAVPEEIDVFDLGLSHGERPRLFVDMVTFVEMGHDRRAYRLMRDGRRGRICAAESVEVQPIVDAVTAYVARRLVERERLLVDDDRAVTPDIPQPEVAMAASVPAETKPDIDAKPGPSVPVASPPRTAGRRMLGIMAFLTAFGFGAGLGAIVVGALILAAAKGKLPL